MFDLKIDARRSKLRLRPVLQSQGSSQYLGIDGQTFGFEAKAKTDSVELPATKPPGMQGSILFGACSKPG